MKYRDGYKYQIAADEYYQLNDITLEDGRILKAPRGYNIVLDFLTLDPGGLMTLFDGYATDGPSGPTIDNKYCMRGACGHDGGYQLERSGLLPPEFREYFDACLYKWVLEDGMKVVERWNHPSPVKWAEKEWIKARITLWYNGVRYFASFAADPKNEKIVYDTEAA